MKIYIGIDLLSMAQDARILTLLQFPQDSWLSEHAKLKIVRRVEGYSLHPKTSNSLERFIAQAATQKHNEIRIKYHFQ